MPVLMKDNYYNYDSLHDLASRIKAVFPSFQENDFADHIMNEISKTQPGLVTKIARAW